MAHFDQMIIIVDCRIISDDVVQLAFRYLSMALVPLLIGYAIYSLIYEEHKGWYSFVVSMLAGAVYTFGALSEACLVHLENELDARMKMIARTSDVCFQGSL